MVVSRPRSPFLPPIVLLECALEPAITRAEILTCASRAHSVPAIDSSTAVRHNRSVRLQHYREHIFPFMKTFVYLLLVCSLMQRNLLWSRAQGLYDGCWQFSRRSTGGGD